MVKYSPFSNFSSTCAWVIGWEFIGRVNPAALHRSSPELPTSEKNSEWRSPALSQVLFGLLMVQIPVAVSPANVVMHVPLLQPAIRTTANRRETLIMVTTSYPRRVIAGAFVAVSLLGACNKHNVPLGGECDKGEDCGPNTLACYKPAGQDRGYCSQTCVVSPPKGAVPGGAGCESSGMVCKKASAAHPILGEVFCVKP